MWWRNRRPASAPVAHDVGPDQQRRRWADLVDSRSTTDELDTRLRDALREPTQLLPLVGSVLMTPAAQWRAFGGRS